jgi:hypothetical protein
VNKPHDAKELRGRIDPASDDSALLALERQFNEMVADLLTAERVNEELAGCSVLRSSGQRADQLDALHDGAARTKAVEAILVRLYPVERAIMQTPARTVAGLGVKARHAAYVMSEHWEAPIDRIDWDAQAVRLLIEAVCDFAGTPLHLRNFRESE